MMRLDRHSEDFVAAHEELIREHLEKYPNASEVRAFLTTLPHVVERMIVRHCKAEQRHRYLNSPVHGGEPCSK